MKNLIEYTRLVFEERYKKEETPFKCVKARKNNGFGECICIPGIALNYCAIAAECCYSTQELILKVQWNETHKMYLPVCFFEDEKLVTNLQKEQGRNTCKHAVDLCAEEINTFSFIRIREDYDEDIRKEYYLCNRVEDFRNAMDYFRLFTLIADGYNHVEKIEVHGERLFRLFLFLFPKTALKIIEENCIFFNGNSDFKAYNKALLEEYLSLGEGAQDKNITRYDEIGVALKKLNDFTGFNFYRVYQRYQEEKAEAEEVKELVKTQMDLCSKKRRTIKKILKNL